MPDPKSPAAEPVPPAQVAEETAVPAPAVPREVGGRASGVEPTRYGDWEKDGRCIDF